MHNLPIYVVSRANPERMHTATLLRAAGVPFTLVVDNPDQRRAAAKMGYVALSTGTDNLVDKRNAISKMADGWYIGMDDNIQEFLMVAKKYRRHSSLPVDNGENWRPRYNQPCSAREYVDQLARLADDCRNVGAAYGGVATMENPFFRAKRFGYRRFVKSKVFVMDGSAGVPFKHSMCHDSYASAYAVALRGRVVVDQFLFYRANWYEKGGLGSRKDREERGLLDQLQSCIDEFPGLVGMARGQNSALRFLRTSDNSVEKWRRENGWINKE